MTGLTLKLIRTSVCEMLETLSDDDYVNVVFVSLLWRSLVVGARRGEGEWEIREEGGKRTERKRELWARDIGERERQRAIKRHTKRDSE